MTIAILRRHRARRQYEARLLGTSIGEDDLVFAWADGRPLLPNTVTHAWGRLARKVGLGGVRLHDARHTHATLMLAQNVHPKVVQERLGHSTITTTLDIYSHVAPSLQQAAALRFEEGLSGQTTLTPDRTPVALEDRARQQDGG